MTGATKADTAAIPADRAALVHAIYRIAQEPRSNDVFMDHWDSRLSHALADLAALHDGTSLTDPEIDPHFVTAFNILQELGRPGQSRAVDGEGPRMLVDVNGLVVLLNGAAATTFGLDVRSQIDSLGEYCVSPARVPHTGCSIFGRLSTVSPQVRSGSFCEIVVVPSAMSQRRKDLNTLRRYDLTERIPRAELAGSATV